MADSKECGGGDGPPAEFPDIADLDAKFLSRCVGAKVKKFEVHTAGIGFICDAHRVNITEYDGPEGPPSLILKVSKPDKASRETNKGFYQLEAHWYRNVAEHTTLKGAKAYGVFTDPKDEGRFMLVLEDLALVDGNEHFANWMVGVDQDVMEKCLEDLAVLHGKFWKSPLIDELLPPCPVPEGLPLKEGSYWAPFVGFSMFAYAPFPGAAAAGFDEGTTACDMVKRLFEDQADYLQLDYEKGGKTFRLGKDGPFKLPDEYFKNPLGAGVVLKACEKLGKKPRTLLHGDGHPGNVFLNRKTGNVTWIDFQGYNAGPPGSDLSQALGLGVRGATKAKLEEIMRKYHAKLVECGPPGIAEEYPFEECWEDTMLGMVVWYAAYLTVHALTLPGMKEDPAEEMRLQGFRVIVPNYISLLDDLDFMDSTVAGLAKEVLADVAAAGSS